MALIDDLAAKLSGSRRAEDNVVLTDATTRTYIGVATSDSEDGSVYIDFGGDITLPDEDDREEGDPFGVEVPTTADVREGDEVIVTVYGGDSLKSPVVTGVAAGGDRTRATMYELRDDLDLTNADVHELTTRIRYGTTEGGVPFIRLYPDPNDMDGISLTLTNSRIGFSSNGTEVAYISDSQLYIENGRFVRVQDVGDWRWRQRGNNHLTLTYEGVTE